MGRQTLLQVWKSNCSLLGRAAKASVAAACFLTLASVATPDAAQARNATCSGIEAQLASLTKSNNRKRTRAFSKAISAQREQISSVTRKMNGYGCVAKKRLFQREAHPSCRGLRNSLVRMKRNLRQLQAGATGGSSDTSRQKSKLQRALRRHKCSSNAPNDGIRRTSIVQQIFGGEASRQRREQARQDRQELLRLRGSQYESRERYNVGRKLKTSRTVCVRTCDGYHFPVSFSASDASITGVAQACHSLCPGRDMQLYYYKNSNKKPQNLVSVETGLYYTDLPTAFEYKKAFNPNCSCNYRMVDRSQQQEPNEFTLPAIVENQTVSTGKIGVPSWRDMKDEDILRGAPVEPVETVQAAPVKIPEPVIEMSQNKRVRIIGKSYFPAQ